MGEQDVAGHVGHRQGPAQKPLVDVLRDDEMVQDAAQSASVEPAGEDLDVQGFLVEHVDQLEPVQVAVLQVFEVLQEHDVQGGAVDVDEDRAASWFDLQGGAEDGQHRRDARAGRDGPVPLALTGVQGGGKAAGRRHDVQHVARPEPFGYITRKDAVRDPLDADAQPAGGSGGADGVVAAHVVTY